MSATHNLDDSTDQLIAEMLQSQPEWKRSDRFNDERLLGGESDPAVVDRDDDTNLSTQGNRDITIQEPATESFEELTSSKKKKKSTDQRRSRVDPSAPTEQVVAAMLAGTDNEEPVELETPAVDLTDPAEGFSRGTTGDIMDVEPANDVDAWMATPKKSKKKGDKKGDKKKRGTKCLDDFEESGSGSTTPLESSLPDFKEDLNPVPTADSEPGQVDDFRSKKAKKVKKSKLALEQDVMDVGDASDSRLSRGEPPSFDLNNIADQYPQEGFGHDPDHSDWLSGTRNLADDFPSKPVTRGLVEGDIPSTKTTRELVDTSTFAEGESVDQARPRDDEQEEEHLDRVLSKRDRKDKKNKKKRRESAYPDDEEPADRSTQSMMAETDDVSSTQVISADPEDAERELLVENERNSDKKASKKKKRAKSDRFDDEPEASISAGVDYPEHETAAQDTMNVTRGASPDLVSDRQAEEYAYNAPAEISRKDSKKTAKKDKKKKKTLLPWEGGENIGEDDSGTGTTGVSITADVGLGEYTTHDSRAKGQKVIDALNTDDIEKNIEQQPTVEDTHSERETTYRSFDREEAPQLEISRDQSRQRQYRQIGSSKKYVSFNARSFCMG